MSDSPETDAETMDGIDCYGEPLKSWDYKSSKDGEVVPAEFARKLERERDDALKEWDLARDGWIKALEERDEARREMDELRTERNQAREVAKLAFYIIRGVDPKFVKLAYERSVYWNGQDQPIQFMRDAIKAWAKEQKEEA